MEASHPLSIESFSYSWLVNLKPSLDDHHHEYCDEASSFIEMDPRMPPSKRFFRNSQDFKFDFPISQPPIKLVHADELFSDGYVMPLFVNSMKMEGYEYERVSDDSVSTTMPIIAASHDSVLQAAGGSKPNRLRRCRRLSKRMLLKYLDFIRPLYRRIRGRYSSKSSSSMAESTKKNKWLYSSAETSSPRISVAYSAPDEWRNSCDSDGSIYEAVLHCKKSIGT